jgi:hypothetical protein
MRSILEEVIGLWDRPYQVLCELGEPSRRPAMLDRFLLSGRTDLLDNHQLATRRRPSRLTGAIAIFC